MLYAADREVGGPRALVAQPEEQEISNLPAAGSTPAERAR